MQWPIKILKQWVNNKNYQQPIGTYNALYQTLSIKIDQTIHQVRFKNWNIKWESYWTNGQEYLYVPEINFDRQNRTINFKFNLQWDWWSYGQPQLNWKWQGWK